MCHLDGGNYLKVSNAFNLPQNIVIGNVEATNDRKYK